jgi:hypothetical protein
MHCPGLHSENVVRATGQRRSLPDLGPKGRHSVAQGVRRCGKIAALPPDLRKGSAFPYLGLNTKAFGAGALAGRLSADQAAQPPTAWEQ